MIKNLLWLLKMMKCQRIRIVKLMDLISLSFKKIYKPTNNNIRTSSNTSRANQDKTLRINRGTGYDNQRVVNVVGARENVGIQVVQQSRIQCYNCKEYGHVARECQKLKWAKDATYHKEKMLLSHCMYMAQIQEVTLDAAEKFGPIYDVEPLQKVQNNDDNYNVFVIESEHPEQPEYFNDTYPVEQDEHNMIIDSLDMSYDKEQVDKDDDDLAKECDLLASLIEKLKCEIDDNKNRSKFLKTSNKALVDKLKGEIEDFKTKNKSLESSNNHFKKANNELSKTNQLMFKDLKKFQAELDRYYDVNYASKVAIDCAKAKGDLMSYKIESEKLESSIKDKGIAISELKKLIEKMKGKSMKTKFEKSSAIRQPNAFKSQRQSNLGVIPTSSFNRPQLKSNQLEDRVMHNNSQGKKQKVEDHRRNFKFSNNKTFVTACNDSLNANTSNVNFVCVTYGKCVLNDNHDTFFLHYINGVNSRTKIPIGVPVSTREHKRIVNQSMAIPLKRTVASESTNQKPRHTTRKLYEHISKTVVGAHRDNSIHRRLWCLKHMTGNLKLLINFVEKFMGLNHNLFSVGQFFDADLEVAFRKYTCYIRDLKGNDLLTGSYGTYLYSITLQDTSTTNLICLMAKASSSQAWLWHRRLSHLNFDTINLLSKNGIVIGLSKLKFVKDHFCSSCELGKAKRKSFHTKTTLSSKRLLQILHMDLCGLMRVKSFNGKKYVLVIIDDYSRYTWTYFLSLSPGPLGQENAPQAAETVTTSNELDLLFSLMFDELLNGLWYPKDTSFELTAFSDSDHAGCLGLRKSTSSGIQFLGGDKLVSWSSKKHDCTSMSLEETEYVSLSSCCAQVLWLRTNLADYGFHFDKIPVYCDSKAAIAISCNLIQHSRTKHIDVRYHFIKEHVEKGIVELIFVGTEY
uniref:CCHC-type domain-containing protein n=1 Tax=Tanacetum cinerariifolium TaxID=118510 RepID=A0A6L2LS59_TANCI|nr:hypothetical protein [Tanacetum cinerariifolium]